MCSLCCPEKRGILMPACLLDQLGGFWHSNMPPNASAAAQNWITVQNWFRAELNHWISIIRSRGDLECRGSTVTVSMDLLYCLNTFCRKTLKKVVTNETNSDRHQQFRSDQVHFHRVEINCIAKLYETVASNWKQNHRIPIDSSSV